MFPQIVQNQHAKNHPSILCYSSANVFMRSVNQNLRARSAPENATKTTLNQLYASLILDGRFLEGKDHLHI